MQASGTFPGKPNGLFTSVPALWLGFGPSKTHLYWVAQLFKTDLWTFWFSLVGLLLVEVPKVNLYFQVLWASEVRASNRPDV